MPHRREWTPAEMFGAVGGAEMSRARGAKSRTPNVFPSQSLSQNDSPQEGRRRAVAPPSRRPSQPSPLSLVRSDPECQLVCFQESRTSKPNPSWPSPFAPPRCCVLTWIGRSSALEYSLAKLTAKYFSIKSSCAAFDGTKKKGRGWSGWNVVKQSDPSPENWRSRFCRLAVGEKKKSRTDGEADGPSVECRPPPRERTHGAEPADEARSSRTPARRRRDVWRRGQKQKKTNWKETKAAPLSLLPLLKPPRRSPSVSWFLVFISFLRAATLEKSFGRPSVFSMRSSEHRAKGVLRPSPARSRLC